MTKTTHPHHCRHPPPSLKHGGEKLHGSGQLNLLYRGRDLLHQSDAVAQLSPSQLLPVSVAELHSPVGVVEVADLHPAKNDVPVLVLESPGLAMPSLPTAGLPVLRGSGLRPR